MNILANNTLFLLHKKILQPHAGVIISFCNFMHIHTAMTTNEELITRFYTCFSKGDYRGMQNCYAGNATFSDPVFQNLDAAEVKAMWEMLCKRGKDMQITFTNVTANEQSGSAEWTAVYTFSASGRKVINHVSAKFRIENGLFIQHTDTFNFHKWAHQALGLKGWLLGGTSFLKNKVRTNARKSLSDFMKK